MKILFTAVMVICAFNSQAGLLIDPYIGVGQSKTTLDVVNNDDSSNTATYLGSRLGYSKFLFSAGIDYQIASSEIQDEDSRINNLSAFVGVDLPILFRFWAEYFISSDINNDDLDLSFKNGYGLGVGFTGLPFVSLNLEIEALNFDAEVLNQDVDFTVAQTVLSVSFPINL